MTTAANPERYWEDAIDSLERAMFGQVQATTLETYDVMLTSVDDSLDLLNRFQKKWGTRRYSDLQFNALMDLRAQLLDRFEPVGNTASLVYPRTAGSVLETLNEVAADFGKPLLHGPSLRNFVDVQRFNSLSLSDVDTRGAVNGIFQELRSSWQRQDFTTLEPNIRAMLGVDQDLRGNMLRAMNQAKRENLTGAQLNARIKELAGEQRGLAAKVSRIIRTEGAGARHDMYVEFRETSFADGSVTYERLINEANACDVCVSMQGVYAVGTGPQPPLHPHCVCSYVVVVNGFDPDPSAEQLTASRARVKAWDKRQADAEARRKSKGVMKTATA